MHSHTLPCLIANTVPISIILDLEDISRGKPEINVKVGSPAAMWSLVCQCSRDRMLYRGLILATLEKFLALRHGCLYPQVIKRTWIAVLGNLRAAITYDSDGSCNNDEPSSCVVIRISLSTCLSFLNILNVFLRKAGEILLFTHCSVSVISNFSRTVRVLIRLCVCDKIRVSYAKCSF